MKTLPKIPTTIAVFAISVAILLIRLFSNQLYIYWQYWLPIGLWICGGGLGYMVLYADRLVDLYFANPDTELAYYVKAYFAKKQFKKGWQLLMYNKRLQKHLTFRSALFQVVWVLLAFFTISSTSSLFGKGFVLGLGLHLLLDEWQDFVSNKDYLRTWLFWQINKTISDQELQIYLIVMTVINVLFFIKTIY
ncbi:hypothetical protein GYA49_05905 [Candidatus Beckwithbacteria bacterium]|nr:hypothetical protein [Candidatus Beckwithbacteria bacterium]